MADPRSERLHREPDDGDVFIVISKDRRIVRMFTYDNRSYSLFEKKFVSGYQFMKPTVKVRSKEQVRRQAPECPQGREDGETWCKVRKYDHCKKCYIWVLVNKAERIAIFFNENSSKDCEVLSHFLGDAKLKSIVTDGYFFKNIFNGCRDFFSLTPANISMAYAKYRANEYKGKLDCLYRV